MTKDTEVPNIMGILKVRFKGKLGDKWHMLILLDKTGTAIKFFHWFRES